MQAVENLDQDVERVERIIEGIDKDVSLEEFFSRIITVEDVESALKRDAKNLVYKQIGVVKGNWGNSYCVEQGGPMDRLIQQKVGSKLGEDFIEKLIQTKVNQCFARGLPKSIEESIDEWVENAVERACKKALEESFEDIKNRAAGDMSKLVNHALNAPRTDDGISTRDAIMRGMLMTLFKAV